MVSNAPRCYDATLQTITEVPAAACGTRGPSGHCWTQAHGYNTRVGTTLNIVSSIECIIHICTTNRLFKTQVYHVEIAILECIILCM